MHGDARMAFRVAKFAKAVTVDDVLAARLPSPGTCPRCGKVVDNTEATDGVPSHGARA